MCPEFSLVRMLHQSARSLLFHQLVGGHVMGVTADRIRKCVNRFLQSGCCVEFE